MSRSTRMQYVMRHLAATLPTLTLFAWAGATIGCVPKGEAPPKVVETVPPPYQANFGYAVPASGRKIDVTVGIVAPQFSGDGIDWWKSRKTDDVTKAMVRNLRTSFTELFTAKGFNTAGPFDSVDDMTFPEKKGSDFVLYPDFDVDMTMVAIGGVAPATPVQEKPKAEGASFSLGDMLGGGGKDAPAVSATAKCTATLKMSGTVLLTVKEPLSGEKMWTKKIDVSEPIQKLEFTGYQCNVENGQMRGASDAWAKANEDMYQSVMKSLDRYVNAEEFQDLKKQSLDLRAKKVY